MKKIIIALTLILAILSTCLSIKELNLMYSTIHGNKGENNPFDKDIFTGSVGGFISDGDALDRIASFLETDRSNLIDYKIQAKPSNRGNGREMVYVISVKFKGFETTYNFEVNCKSGKVVNVDVELPDFGPSAEDEQGDGSEDKKPSPNNNQGSPEKDEPIQEQGAQQPPQSEGNALDLEEEESSVLPEPSPFTP